MPDIFISYKQEERGIAANLASRLTEEGYDVWWDAALLAGERFEDEIAEVLSASRAVIVLWSRKSVLSDWVKAEAESARLQRKVLPTVIDDLPLEGLPLLFRGLHVTPLKDWQGEPSHAGFSELMKAVRERVGAASGPSLTPSQAEAKLAEGIGEAEIWAAISATSDPSAEEYRAYLNRFGPNARFAELAHIRIARIERREQGAAAQIRPSVPPAAPAEPPHEPVVLEHPASPRRNGNPQRWWQRPLPILLGGLLVVVAAGVGWLALNGTLMTTVSDMFVPQEAKDAAARCLAWSTSPKTDWTTGAARLEATTVADCTRAAAAFPKNAAYTGALALVRIEQGSAHADEAIALANQGVAAKSALANLAMGIMYERGVNLPADIKRAANYYRAAADLGLARGAAKLCLIGLDTGNPPEGLTGDDLRRYCDSANEAGDALGRFTAGYIREAGFGTDKTVDHAGAADLYRQGADQGNPESQLALGSLFQRGVGVDRDYARAMGLFSAAADAGFPEGLRNLAIMYELGQGTSIDVNHAAQLYETASIKGDLLALFLADYGVGASVRVNNRLTREMERIAEEPTNPVGLRMLGQLFERGYMRDTDLDKAVASYTACSDTGNAMCEVALGYDQQFRLGQAAKAVELYQKAADEGNLYGQYWLAYSYDNGNGIDRDPDKAIAYYRLAANQGHLSAINRLAELNQPAPQ